MNLKPFAPTLFTLKFYNPRRDPYIFLDRAVGSQAHFRIRQSRFVREVVGRFKKPKLLIPASSFCLTCVSDKRIRGPDEIVVRGFPPSKGGSNERGLAPSHKYNLGVETQCYQSMKSDWRVKSDSFHE